MCWLLTHSCTKAAHMTVSSFFLYLSYQLPLMQVSSNIKRLFLWPTIHGIFRICMINPYSFLQHMPCHGNASSKQNLVAAVLFTVPSTTPRVNSTSSIDITHGASRTMVHQKCGTRL